MISKNKIKILGVRHFFLVLWVFLFNISCTKEDLVFKNFNSRAASKDSTVPQLTSVEYINFSNQTNYTLLGSCPEGVEKVMLEVNSDAVNALTLSCSSGQFTTPFDFSPFLDGTVNIKMIPYSATTTEQMSEKITSAILQKDTLAPAAPSAGSLSLLGLISNYFNSSSVSPVFSWGATVDLESGLDRYEVKIVSGLPSIDVTTWSSMNSGGSLSGLSLSEGQSYSYQLRVWDKAGNVSSEVQSILWTVDSALPVIATFNDGTDSFYKDRTPLFAIQSNDVSGSGVVSYKVDVGTSVGASDILSGFVVTTWNNDSGFHKFHVGSLTLTAGLRYYASVRAVDFAGNISAPFLGDGWLVNKELFVTNNTVNTLTKKNDKLYIGGSFTELGPWTGGGLKLNLISNAGDAIWPNPNAKARVSGSVSAAISDGSGGFYIGGLFSHVGGLPRSNLAHILSDGSVDTSFIWDVDKEVKTLALSVGNILYVGGLFTKIGGNNRNYLASIDLGTNTITTWTPNPIGAVNVIALNGTTLFVGGSFTNISSVGRNRIAAYDTTGLNPTLILWNPSSSGQVNAIAVSGSTVYVGGLFTNIGGQNRNRIAALDIATGLADIWNPSSSGQVNAIAVSGST
ncbi:MAG TPA: delta-60 repeat domain-containing protein, partial [Pseudobdellovibrionaceae bacterium]|nr:delta-60 repeat domain-containing protein [Pseudobdellovibrionaceae bacterium]